MTAETTNQPQKRKGAPAPTSARDKAQGPRVDRADPYPTLPRRSLVRDLLPGEAP